MSLPLLGALGGLALVDSTSIGTLLLPVWFLLVPHGVRTGRYLLYLGTLAVFYALVGVALLLGGRAWLGDVGRQLETTSGARVALVVGVALLVGSFFIGNGKGKGPGRLSRWRDRAMGPFGAQGTSGRGGVVGLALLAGTIEVASMLPYLGAIGLLATSDLSLAPQLGLLAGYCLLMVAPAVVLLGLRLGARRWVEPQLQRLAAWMERGSGETMAWVVGIIGFLVARNAWPQADLAALWESLAG